MHNSPINHDQILGLMGCVAYGRIHGISNWPDYFIRCDHKIINATSAGTIHNVFISVYLRFLGVFGRPWHPCGGSLVRTTEQQRPHDRVPERDLMSDDGV